MNPKLVIKEINGLISDVIACGVCIDQNFPSQTETRSGCIEIGWGESNHLSIAMKNVDYEHIYRVLDERRLYSFKLIDGALIQIMYKFDSVGLVSHRLAFFPSYSLESYQNDPELYEKEDLYADILAKNLVPVPIRFDYNRDEDGNPQFHHAKSHLTLGQYKNCRIPVIGPLSATSFVDFILRNFYSTLHQTLKIKDDQFVKFERTITADEERLLHLNMI
ncbi:DUF2290 domain-containing protein [Bacillus spizizenii]|uniref:DUF2290 domain-containing protein n=1 Tax=Bacillus subtilis group TaxID=653685 RepID=UPI0002896A1A|nr:DUF2290 domain-containing protein [Bacillus vallismortis]MCY7763086.1 DUF2290 domain-containing protein [Bacillus spizizenii]MBG9771392.1 hypothetical protein [Bacillus vallismortis]MCY8684236.1 DUF2290 domain-containing protein [Bacillus spizizenii]MCY8698086.1 DUF2290 domain-containing protein [Bacillus spizizenii]MCY9120279.1 DUF2290 domain-containing protein [Bacillus spizizenii]